jgi:hypothetical protein
MKMHYQRVQNGSRLKPLQREASHSLGSLKDTKTMQLSCTNPQQFLNFGEQYESSLL